MKVYKKVLSISICILITLLVYSYICMIVTPKVATDRGGTRFYRGTGFMAEPVNSIDVVVYGNSDVYSGISPATLFEKYGYTSYASGTALQNIRQINRLLDKTFEKQNPKVAILEVDCLYNGSRYSIDYTNFFISPFIFHSRWKDLKIRDFYTMPSRMKKYDITKGHVASNDICDSKSNDYMGKVDAKPECVSSRTYKQVMTFIKKCREKNIQVVFLELPSATSWNYAKHNYIKELATKNNIPFIDLNIANSEYCVDFSKDFRDNGNHLNSFGAAKATEYVGKFIKNSYSNILEDKRQDKNYGFWFDVVKHYNDKMFDKKYIN